jgi:hypothetical protein
MKATEAIFILCKLLLIMEKKFPDNVPDLSAISSEYVETDLY